MCNPRRVEVTATRQLTQAWEHEVRRLATVTGTAVAEVRIREEMDAGIGQPTLDALADVLAGQEDWQEQDGAFRRDFEDGYLLYHVEEQELEIVVRLTAEVSAEAEAAVTARGQLDEAISATGTGRYYDDGWGGVTEADARRVAEQAAEQALGTQSRQRAAQERDAAEQAHDEEVRALAQQQAEAELAARVAEQASALRAEALGRLSAAGIEARTLFHQVLALAYRDAILAYAREHHASGIVCTDTGGVVDIQFEMEIGA
jgi:hypothetical protein